jgi:drug/metabolite transporter (DMT)-like permease
MRDLPRIALAGALGIAAYNLLLNTGELTVDAGTASFIVNTSPLFTAAFGALFLRERMRPWGWIGILLSVVGVSTIAIARGSLSFGSGTPLVLSAAICQATQFALQKPLITRYGPLTVTTSVILVGTLLLLPFLASGLSAVRNAHAMSLASVAFLGVGPAATSYLAWSYVLSHMPVSRAASFLYLVPAVATVIALVWLKEIPAPAALLGGFLALSGVIVVNTLGRSVRNPV